MNAATQKAKQTRADKSAKYAEQTVTIDHEWKIVRADELNWEIQFKGRFQGFYGTIVAALEALPAKMLGEVAKGSLNEVRRSVRAIQETIDNALAA